MISLITGASGFIGKKLIIEQLSKNKKIAVFVKNKNKLGNLATLPIITYEGDITNFNSLKQAFIFLNSKNTIETVFHLAANTKYWENKTILYKDNVDSTINLFNLACRYKVKNFIFTSSIEAMGTVSFNQIPANESSIPRPVSAYGWSKLEAENQLIELSKKNRNTNLTILRLANVYGPDSPAFVLPIIRAMQTKNRFLKSSPYLQENIFHPIFIDDAIKGISLAENNNLSGEIFIIAGEEFISLGDYFQKIALLMNINFKTPMKKPLTWLQLKIIHLFHKINKKADLIDYLLGAKNNRLHRAYSIEKARNYLTFSPEFNINKGLAKTMGWLKENKLI